MQPNSMNNFDTLEKNIDAFNTAVTVGFWDKLFADPILLLGYCFAFVAALAFVMLFLRGFLSGLPKVFSMDWHEEHQQHHRVRATQGFFMLLYLFITWELVRWILGGVLQLFGR
jgi:hypothetical protein